MSPDLAPTIASNKIQETTPLKKSEIVVPIFVNIGQIDIDSHALNPFTESDERFLEFVNGEIEKLY